MSLLDKINQLAVTNVDNENKWYRWPVNESKLPEGIKLSATENEYQKNIELKELLCEYALVSDEQKAIAINYYISDWGRVRGNHKETLMKYCVSDPLSLIEMGMKGIASWSKALCIINPNKYAIFDARVSVSLNCLLLASDVADKKLFPILPSQNKKITNANSEFKRILKTNSTFKKESEATFYNNYLNLLDTVAKQQNTNIATIEMLLFAKAEELSEQTFHSPCTISTL